MLNLAAEKPSRKVSGPFAPPNAAQVAKHLDRHEPRRPSRVLAWLPMLALGMALALTFSAADNFVFFLFPWLLLAGVFILFGVRVRRARWLDAQTVRAQEMAMLRRAPQSLRMAWRLLPSVVTIPELHGRTVALIAHNLDQLKAYDAAIVAYGYLIDHLPPEHPGSIQLRIQRAVAQIAGDQLTDADEALRRLRGTVDEYRGTPIAASYRLANLIQQTHTNHHADAVETSGTLLDDLRPLGVDAGYGHALMALSFHRMGQSETPDPAHAQQAAMWWSRATTLLSPETLIDRFRELMVMKELA